MRTIQPLDETLHPPEQIQDQSNLSELYKHPTLINNTSTASMIITNETISFRSSVILNLFVIVPYILSFISVTMIYMLGGVPKDVGEAFENRAYTILLTIPALLPWIFSLRKLKMYLSAYQVSLIFFLFIHSLFLFPALKVGISLFNKGWPLLGILAMTYILSQAYISSVASIYNGRNIVSLRTIFPAVLLAVLIFLAVVT